MDQQAGAPGVQDGVINLDLNLGPSSSLQYAIVISDDDNHIGREEAAHACSYCNRKFLNTQALGGHQTVHRHERTFRPRKRTRKPRRQVATSSPVQAPAVHWLHAGGGELRGACEPASAAEPLVDSTSAWGHENGEAAAAPEMDLSLKLWSG